MHSKNPSCSILGAGIGGLTLALALKLQGVEAEIYERASEVSEIGAGLLLSPNAVSILYALGLREELSAVSVRTPEWQVLNPNGSILSRIRPQSGEIPAIALRRTDLQQLLLHHLELDRIHLGFEARQISSASDRRPIILFADGQELSSDWIAVADGIHSQIRSNFFQETDKRPSHYLGWRAMVDFVPKGWEGGLVTETWGQGQRFGLASTGFGRCYWYASANIKSAQAISSPTRRSLLLRLFEKWHHPVLDILSATRNEEILETSISERPIPKFWHKDDVVLLGDAAHAMTPNLGQGAAMAIEDAWELSQCLKDSPNLRRAWHRYERRRRNRVKMVQWASRLVGFAIQTQSPFLCYLRDNLVRNTPAMVSQASLGWILSPRVKT